MTADELAEVREAIVDLHQELCEAYGQNIPAPAYAVRATEILNRQIPDENRAPPVYPTGLYE